jgi:hypothetical protein
MTSKIPCYRCNKPTPLNPQAKGGDVFICLHCGVVNFYQEDGTSRKPTVSDMQQFPLKTLMEIVNAHVVICTDIVKRAAAFN